MASRSSSQEALAQLEQQLAELERQPGSTSLQRQVDGLRQQVEALRQEVDSAHRRVWQRVELARHPQRPYTLDYIALLFEKFEEIHGDRVFGDDPAILCGLARFHGEPVLVIGQQKGRDTKERVLRNFGQPKPEGYRKALRAMQIAAKFRRPVFTLVDTQGAYPGVDAEARGQAEAIARNLREIDRKSTRLNSSHIQKSRMPSSA